MFAKRGMCYLKINPKATNACVKVDFYVQKRFNSILYI